MKIIETYIYYVIYNITKDGYYSRIESMNDFKAEYEFNKLINNAITFDTRAEANEYVREWIDRDDADKYKVKKIRLDYSINNWGRKSDRTKN